jgi:putative ATPase
VSLSQILRPKNLESFIGQSHIISSDKPLYKLIKKCDIPHLFFYGSAGSGKTSLARIIASEIKQDFYELNATSLKIDEIRKIINNYKNSLLKPLIFLDEVHRLSKTQQEVLLPYMEDYSITLIGASTENPYFSLTSAIRSRAFLYEFKSLDFKEMSDVLKSAKSELNIKSIPKESKEYLIYSSGGDARAMLNLLEFAYKSDENLSLTTLKALRVNMLGSGMGSSSSQTHYDLTSAMIKSIRGSDIDAGLYYLARLIIGAEPPEYIARRLMILASEDIGNANPNALNLANSTMQSVAKIGYPEARIILAQCVVYLASSPKSNSSYKAINKAIKIISEDGKYANKDIPLNIQDNHQNYLNPHDNGGYVKQEYLKSDVKLYQSSMIGFEKSLNEWINKIKSI